LQTRTIRRWVPVRIRIFTDLFAVASPFIVGNNSCLTLLKCSAVVVVLFDVHWVAFAMKFIARMVLGGLETLNVGHRFTNLEA
jgi:hypothetical protein